ncbi:hypothetical protein [Corynebacterium macginleyi]|nr:hypothetical protein [Corynebacterium macginleyi]
MPEPVWVSEVGASVVAQVLPGFRLHGLSERKSSVMAFYFRLDI